MIVSACASATVICIGLWMVDIPIQVDTSASTGRHERAIKIVEQVGESVPERGMMEPEPR